MKIVHIIAGLNEGGAEKALIRLAEQDLSNQHTILSFLDIENNNVFKSEKNVKIISLGIKNKYLDLYKIFKITFYLNKIKPDIVQTWMYYANFIGGLVAYFSGFRDIIWCLHSQSADSKEFSITIKVISYLSKKFSKILPKVIICCSETVRDSNVKYGYNEYNSDVIYNGLDIKEFNKINLKENAFYNLHDKYKDEFKIGMVARWDKFKDFETLFKSLNLFKKYNKKFILFLAGLNLINENQKLTQLTKKYNLQKHVVYLGHVNKTNQLYNILDITILSSFSEGLPTVLIESMACETLCVSTDVGDSKIILSKYGWLSKKSDYKQLFAKLKDAYILKKTNLNQWKIRKSESRKHIKKYFDIKNITNSYIQIWNYIFLQKNLLTKFSNFEIYQNDLSIVITTIGDAHFKKTIDHINNQNNLPKQILVCIPNQNYKKVSYLKKYKNVKVISCDKFGQVSQRLIGFLNVKTNFVLHLDDDCLINSKDVNKMIFLSKTLGDKFVIGPSFIDSVSNKPFHKLNKNFFNSFILKLFFNIPFGYNRMGKLTDMGMNYGVDHSVLKENFKKVDWLSGGCVLHRKKNLILEDYYPFKGKAYCEDLIHSHLLKEKKLKLIVTREAVCKTPKTNFPIKSSEIMKYIDAFKFFHNLNRTKNHKIKFNLWYFYTRYFRTIK
ncbi:MAG: hypothetical protein CMI96_04100 [Pelagibacteraceae bacterium]|nr:hypothetical protein [Pelagibacteraceae bacterium]|tara:strand:+ start:23206 stop:25209 length:2004 start_codon:yes stop_codon:yes gene_type:complete